MAKQTEAEFFDREYDESPRAAVGQVYSITRGRLEAYEDLIYDSLTGLKVLEYGCGEGSHSLEMARRGAQVVGIDISPVGIRKAAERAAAAGVSGVEYVVMDAERMTFPDATFDLVIGEGILHHLDLDTAYREIARVLKPGGRAVFMEPLGHNPAMWLFRTLTPSLRTPDEHPLLRRDLRLARRYFGHTEFRYFHLVSFASLLFLKASFFHPVVRALDRVDRTLFKVLPPAGLLSWYSIMVLSRPLGH